MSGSTAQMNIMELVFQESYKIRSSLTDWVETSKISLTHSLLLKTICIHESNLVEMYLKSFDVSSTFTYFRIFERLLCVSCTHPL